MSTSVENVAVGSPDKSVSGGILVAPLGTARPDGPGSAFAEAYESVGYVGADGVTESNTRSVEPIRDWNGDLIRNVQTEHDATLTFMLIESRRAATLKRVFGADNVEVDEITGNVTVRRNSKVLDTEQWIFAMKDENRGRILDVGRGQPTEIGDVSYLPGEAIAYEVTLSLYPDENEDVLVEYIEGVGTGN